MTSDSKEALYDRRDQLERQTSADRAEFEYQIPKGDPYREMDRNKIDAGADIRWQWRRSTTSSSAIDAAGNESETDPQQRWSSFPMQVETQFGYRPFNRKLRFVYELRAQKPPGGKNLPDEFGATILQRRSLYAMLEDLPYNLYAQAGYYRPLFGYYTPDHTFLPQLMMAEAIGVRAYNQQFLTYSVGGSPNLPYVNLHYIARDVSNPIAPRKLSGVAANLGVRFVTKGISLNYSIWNLKDPTNPEFEKRYLLQSLFGSIQIGRLTYSLDLTSLERDDPADELRRGGVYSMDAYFQLWRAIYANAQYAFANSAVDLKVGNTSQVRFGLRSFLTAGTDVTVHYEMEQQTKRERDGSEQTTNLSGLVGQIHVFM
jgi:hypothetical protein